MDRRSRKCVKNSEGNVGVFRDLRRAVGAVRPSVYERRPDSTDSAPEVAEYTEGAFATFDAFS